MAVAIGGADGPRRSVPAIAESFAPMASCAFVKFAKYATMSRSCAGGGMGSIQKGTRVLISLWDSLMFGRVLK